MWHLKLNFEAVSWDPFLYFNQTENFLFERQLAESKLDLRDQILGKKGFFKVLVSENNHSKYKYQPHNFPSLICTHQVTYREASSLVLAH